MNDMNGMRQAWLVAVREIRERSRSRALRASVLVMILAVVGMIVVPFLITSGGGTKDVGLAGAVPAGLPAAIQSQGSAAGITVRGPPVSGRDRGGSGCPARRGRGARRRCPAAGVAASA